MKKIKQKIGDFLYKYKYETIICLVGLVVVFWDLVLKSITDGKRVSVIPNVLGFNYSHNTGAAWSIMSNLTWLLILISIVFIIAIVVANYFYKNKTYFYAISVGLVLSGAIGNLIDRIFFNYVRDFIDLEFINFPTFNLADIAITVGIVLLCVHFLFLSKPKEKVATEQEVNLNAEHENIEQVVNIKENDLDETKIVTEEEQENTMLEGEHQEEKQKTSKKSTTTSNSLKKGTKKSSTASVNKKKSNGGKTQTKKTNSNTKSKTATSQKKSSSTKKQQGSKDAK